MAATDVTPGAGFLVVAKGTFTLDPASIAATSTGSETAAIPEARVGDTVICTPRAQLTAGLVMPQPPRVTADGTVTIYFYNTTAGAIDLGSATWDYMVLRGTIGVP